MIEVQVMGDERGKEKGTFERCKKKTGITHRQHPL
jgi:hypothetical protein